MSAIWAKNFGGPEGIGDDHVLEVMAEHPLRHRQFSDLSEKPMAVLGITPGKNGIVILISEHCKRAAVWDGIERTSQTIRDWSEEFYIHSVDIYFPYGEWVIWAEESVTSLGWWIIFLEGLGVSWRLFRENNFEDPISASAAPAYEVSFYMAMLAWGDAGGELADNYRM